MYTKLMIHHTTYEAGGADNGHTIFWVENTYELGADKTRISVV